MKMLKYTVLSEHKRMLWKEGHIFNGIYGRHFKKVVEIPVKSN